MSKYKCAACGNEVGRFSKECSHCGCDLFIWYCPTCNRQLDNKTPFCPECTPKETKNISRKEQIEILRKDDSQNNNEVAGWRLFAIMSIIFSLPPNMFGFIMSVIACKLIKGQDDKAYRIAIAALLINIIGGILFVLLVTYTSSNSSIIFELYT